MSKLKYEPELKEKIIHLHLEEGNEAYAEIKRLRKELAEAQKENAFLKKRRHSLRRKSTSAIPVCST